MKNRVLVIGSGGREHAIAWRLAQSSTVETVLVAPGNAGTAREDNVQNVVIDTADFKAVIDFCRVQSISLVVVGPEQPLVDGLVDALSDAGIACFGPKAAAAQLEGSKAFTKRFMQQHNIPTAGYAEFNDVNKAIDYLQSSSAGRSGFIPVPTVKRVTNDTADKAVSGQLLLDQINVKSGYESIVDALLGHVVFTENMTEAIEMYNRNGESKTIVTKNGDLISPQGILIGGSKDKLNGILTKKQEIKDLSRRSIALDKKLEKARRDQSTLESEARHLERSN